MYAPVLEIDTRKVTENARRLHGFCAPRAAQLAFATMFLSAPPEVIRAALAQGESDAPLTVIDCPPGSACPVLESAQAADRCLLVAEPTAFGLHNLDMVYRLVILLGKPCGVVINKETEPYAPLEAFCRDRNLPILGRIPYQAARAVREKPPPPRPLPHFPTLGPQRTAMWTPPTCI